MWREPPVCGCRSGDASMAGFYRCRRCGTLLWLDVGRVDVLVVATLAVHIPLYFLVTVPLSARWSARRMVRAAEDD